jgi:hypothetical protein
MRGCREAGVGGTSTSDGQAASRRCSDSPSRTPPTRGPRSTDPEGLGTVAAPVLLLRGQQTLLGTWFADAARHIAQHLVDPHLRELLGVGHFAPLLTPEAIAKEVISFFASARQEPSINPPGLARLARPSRRRDRSTAAKASVFDYVANGGASGWGQRSRRQSRARTRRERHAPGMRLAAPR